MSESILITIIMFLVIAIHCMWRDRQRLIRENTSLWVACESGSDVSLWTKAITRANELRKLRGQL